MSELITFDARLKCEQNTQWLNNMSTIVKAHQDRPIGPDSIHSDETVDNLRISAQALFMSVIIDRSSHTVAAQHNITSPELRDFAQGGAVADIGSGRSDFLDSFTGVASTIAVDTHSAHVETQRSKGHLAIQASGTDLSAIPSQSIKLLNASWSLPFWSINAGEARQTFREYTRVLELGGVALVGPITRRDVHHDWEYTLECLKYHGRTIGPWLAGDRAFLSHTLVAFIDEMLQLRYQGSLDNGFIDVAGYRHSPDLVTDFRQNAGPVQIPNFVMLKRVG